MFSERECDPGHAYVSTDSNLGPIAKFKQLVGIWHTPSDLGSEEADGVAENVFFAHDMMRRDLNEACQAVVDEARLYFPYVAFKRVERFHAGKRSFLQVHQETDAPFFLSVS